MGNVYVAGHSGNRAFIRQYKRDGSLAWERLSAARTGLFAETLATDVDATGNAYLAWAYYGYDDYSFKYLADGPFISKLDKTGKLLWRKPFANLVAMDVDAKGNLYLAGNNSVRKHGAAGGLVWERKPSTFGANMVDIIVAASGNVVASSDNGMIVKYTGGGAQIFRTTRNFGSEGTRDLALGPNEEIAATAVDGDVSEGTATAFSFHVFRPDGTRLWQELFYDDRSQQYIDAAFDASGNVYFTTEHRACDSGVEIRDDYGTGVECKVGTDSDPGRSAILVNNYSPSGVPVWSRVFNKNRAGMDASTAIAAFAENELYLVGTTANSVNGQNVGGLDAFLMRLDAEVNKVWSR